MGALSILEKSVVQANPLIEARKYMNLSELRLFCLGLQDVKPHIKDNTVYDIDFRETFISHKDLLDLFNDNPGGIAHLKKHIKKAFDGKIEIKLDNKGSFMLLHIYQKLIYKDGEGLLIKFDSEMKPYILDLVGKAYTSYQLKAIFPLSSEYAWRLLELMLEKKGYLKKNGVAYCDMTMDEIRFGLNISGDLYKGRMDNFRKYILDNPIKEINEKTDYYIWYDVNKNGRKVTGFKLWIRLKEGVTEIATIKENIANLPPAPSTDIVDSAEILAPMPKSSEEELRMALAAEGMPKPAINTWLKTFNNADVEESLRLAKDHADKRELKGASRKKYIKSCLERNIAATNFDEAQQSKEIDEREKTVAKEKKEATQSMLEGFTKIGLSFDNKKTGLQSFSSIMSDKDSEANEELIPQELSDDTIETIAKLFHANNKHFDASLQESIKKYGYTPETFVKKYRDQIFKAIFSLK